MNSRQKELEQRFLDEEKETLKKLKESYQKALYEIDVRIATLKEREDADMQHVIYQLDYQRALKSQVQTILEQLHNENFETISEYLTKSYEDGFLGTMYDLQGQGIPLIMPINQQLVVAAIMHDTKLSESLYDSLDTKELSKQIASEISRGIASASTFKEIAGNIRRRAKISQNNAMRIARTEAHRIQNKAISDCQWHAKAKGADIVKIWSAALDGRTRTTHRMLDGQVRELGEAFEFGGKKAMEPGGFEDPSEDCNCRCRCNSKARWLLDEESTKYLGNTEKMTDEQLQPIADKLGIDVDELRKYKDQIIPVQAKNYEDFRMKYEKIINHDKVELVKNTVQKIGQIDYMSSSYRPRFGRNRTVVYQGDEIHLKEVSNSRFKVLADVDATSRSKAIRYNERMLAEVEKTLRKGQSIPTVAIVDFKKHGFNINAIAGYDSKTGILYVNSLYDTEEKVMTFLKKHPNWFASTDVIAPYMHELGHKIYYDYIDHLANSLNISYNEAKEKVDSEIREYYREKLKRNQLYIYYDIGGKAAVEFSVGNISELVAECNTVVDSAESAIDILNLLGD